MRTSRLSPAANRVRRFLVAVSVAALGAVAAASGPGSLAAPQQTPEQKPLSGQKPAPGQPPTFRTEANFVRVDVHPTADGRAVQDLRQADFEVAEDGKPQEIATFEHVLIEPGGLQETRSDPRSVSEAKDMVQDPRARLFVLFLDTYHVSRERAWYVRRSLSRLLDRTIGSRDFVAMMTPEMSAVSVTFTRRTGTIDELLDKWIEWGKRHEEVMNPDPVEERYQSCYPPQPGEGAISAIAREMTARRREQMTLDAMRDLIGYLAGLREERKAILMVSEGWALYRPNSNLARPIDGRIPGPQPVGVGVTGGLQIGDPSRNPGGATARECDTDRMMLAQEDHERRFREMLDEANRGNSSFYPIDPRGLDVFDSDMSNPLPVNVDMAMVHARQETLQTLAVATDGIAVMNSNDIDKGLKRVVDDLSSYYLLGYYSTNAKADGRFHSISVKVKRPGVSVRARRGYRSATKEELEAATRGATAAAKNEAAAATRAVNSLATLREDAMVHATAGYEWRPSASGTPDATLWIVTELDPAAGSRDEQWNAGADVAITVTAADKSPVGEVKQLLKRDERSTIARIPLSAAASLPEDYAIRVTSKPAGATLGSTETLRLVVPRPSGDALMYGQPLLYRRGPFSGPGWRAAADPRYRRQERVKVEVPVVGMFTSAQVQLLDRNGKALANIPVATTTREENGQKIVSGEVTLAALTTGDYVLETSIQQGQVMRKVLAAFRIIL